MNRVGWVSDCVAAPTGESSVTLKSDDPPRDRHRLVAGQQGNRPRGERREGLRDGAVKSGRVVSSEKRSHVFGVRSLRRSSGRAFPKARRVEVWSDSCRAVSRTRRSGPNPAP